MAEFAAGSERCDSAAEHGRKYRLAHLVSKPQGFVIKEKSLPPKQRALFLAPYFMSPSCSPLVSSPSVPFERRRSSCGQMPTSYDLFRESNPSLPLQAVLLYQPSPISPFELAPFSAVKLPIQFASVGLFGEMIRNRVVTRSLKSLGLTSLRATGLLAAPHEAVEAHFLDLP
jgi:hypothetical protein